MTRRRRQYLAGIAAGLLIVSGAVVAIHLAGEGPENEAEGGELPSALERHLERLREAVPGNQGMAAEGPASAAEAAFLQRAYPSDTITIAQMDAAKASFTAAKGRPFASVKHEAKNVGGKPGDMVVVAIK